MSIIQTIRDKYARLAVIAVAVALTGFILIDYISGRGKSLFNSNSTTLGSVNGKAIDQAEFEKEVTNREQNQQQQGGEEERQAIITDQWKQEVNQLVLTQEFNKLGLAVSKNEIADMLYGPEPHMYAKQYFYRDPNTTQYDPNQVRQYVSQLKRSKNKQDKDNFNLLVDAMEKARLAEKYSSLVAGSIHYAKWILEQQNKDNSLMAKVSYVNVPASLISDSAKEVAVTDKEIEDYMDKREDQYKTEDETRTIEYVLFSAAPNLSDSAAAFKNVAAMKSKFAAINDTAQMTSFLATESDLAYGDLFLSKSTIKVPAKDSIFTLAKGAVYGPYRDVGDYVLAKLVDEKDLPDSVFCRHILMRTSGDGALPDSIANKRIDSVINAISKGSNFVTVMKQVSMDKAANSQDSTGLMKFSSQQIQDAEHFDSDFGKYILFDGKKGERKKVKTKFGYHYIEIVDQKNIEPHYKVAYLAKRIEASDETERNAGNAASQFAGESRDIKAFDANFEKELKGQGKQKLIAPDINSHAYEIQGIGVSRKFIRDDIFGASIGDVLQPEKVGENFVVAVVTQIKKPGMESVADARPGIEPILRNQKKAEQLKKRIGNITTLNSVSVAMKQPVITADSIRFEDVGKNPISSEPKVVGAVFNPANKGKVINEPLEGRYGGVYVVSVDNITATVVENADINAQRQNLESQGRMRILMSNQYSQFGYGQQYDPADVLKKAATIKDYRNKFY